MAVTHVGTNTASASLGATIGPPAGTQVGDLLFVSCMGEYGWNNPAPSGWTMLPNNLSNQYANGFYKFATGSDTFTFQYGNAYLSWMVMTAYRGVRAEGPLTAAHGTLGSTNLPTATVGAEGGAEILLYGTTGGSPSVGSPWSYNANPVWYNLLSANQTTTSKSVSSASDGYWTYGTVFSFGIWRASAAPGSPGAFAAPTAAQTYNNSVGAAWGAATDADTAQGSLRYDLDYWNGSAWVDITLTSAGIISHTWSTSALPPGNYYKLRVRAYDGVNYGSFTESATFNINHQTHQVMI